MLDQLSINPVDAVQTQLDSVSDNNLSFGELLQILAEIRNQYQGLSMSDIYLYPADSRVRLQVKWSGTAQQIESAASKQMLLDYELGW